MYANTSIVRMAAVTAATAMHEHMDQHASDQQEIGKRPQHMRAMLEQQEKAGDGQERDQRPACFH
jgi:hypothetical protein